VPWDCPLDGADVAGFDWVLFSDVTTIVLDVKLVEVWPLRVFVTGTGVTVVYVVYLAVELAVVASLLANGL